MMKTQAEITAWHLAQVKATLPTIEDFTPEQLNARNLAAGMVMWRALGVITKDPRIRAFLEANDPQALGQALAARILWREDHPGLEYPEEVRA